MPSPQRPTTRKTDKTVSTAKRCSATTTAGQPCKRPVVAGLTVCKSHGGGTAASVKAGQRAAASQQAAVLWGISSDTSGLSIEAELTKLARNKMTDILAIRLELGLNPTKTYGLMLDSKETTEAEVGEEIYVTVKTKKSVGVHILVQELHKAENELVPILRLLHEITGGSEEVDVRRLKLQTARETARILKAFPGISVDEVAAQVSKHA